MRIDHCILKLLGFAHSMLSVVRLGILLTIIERVNEVRWLNSLMVTSYKLSRPFGYGFEPCEGGLNTYRTMDAIQHF